METQPQGERIIEFPCIDQIRIIFSEDRMQEALTAFRTLLGNISVAEQQNSPEQELARLLRLLGWNSAQLKNGSLALTEYTQQQLDLEHDPVLASAVGIVDSGSFVVGHSSSEIASTWWISYIAQEKHINQGIPTKEQIAGLMACPECGSLSPRDWHHIQYTAIRYPVASVNPFQIVKISQGEVLYECVLKEYLECQCGAEIVRNGRDFVS